MAETLKEKTAKGLFWGAMNNGAMQVIGLVFGIVLGRLLTPSDYGMIAMITVFSLIATALQNSGFITAITNLKKPTANDYNSVFWFNITDEDLQRIDELDPLGQSGLDPDTIDF